MLEVLAFLQQLEYSHYAVPLAAAGFACMKELTYVPPRSIYRPRDKNFLSKIERHFARHMLSWSFGDFKGGEIVPWRNHPLRNCPWAKFCPLLSQGDRVGDMMGTAWGIAQEQSGSSHSETVWKRHKAGQRGRFAQQCLQSHYWTTNQTQSVVGAGGLTILTTGSNTDTATHTTPHPTPHHPAPPSTAPHQTCWQSVTWGCQCSSDCDRGVLMSSLTDSLTHSLTPHPTAPNHTTPPHRTAPHCTAPRHPPAQHPTTPHHMRTTLDNDYTSKQDAVPGKAPQQGPGWMGMERERGRDTGGNSNRSIEGLMTRGSDRYASEQELGLGRHCCVEPRQSGRPLDSGGVPFRGLTSPHVSLHTWFPPVRRVLIPDIESSDDGDHPPHPRANGGCSYVSSFPATPHDFIRGLSIATVEEPWAPPVFNALNSCLSPPLCVAFRLVVVSLRGPGQSPVLPSACCVGLLLSVDRCGRCSCWWRFRVSGAQWLVCWSCTGCGRMCHLRVSSAK